MTLKTQPAKHKEFILAIESTYFAEHLVDNKLVEADGETFRQVVPYDFKTFWDLALPYLQISQRAGQEVDHTLRQLLPYLILKQKQADGTYLYFNYWRTKLSGEEKLHGDRSVGFGGHIDWMDLVPGLISEPGTIDLLKTILKSLDREADEELFVFFTDARGEKHRIPAEQWLIGLNAGYLILSKNEKVGRFHVGIVIEAEVHPQLKLTSEEPAIDMAGLASAEELLADPKLEDWSRLFLTFKHVEQVNYDAKLGVSKRRTAVDDLTDLIGEDTFQKIEQLVTELRQDPTPERDLEIHKEIDAFGFIQLVNHGDGVRWSFDQVEFNRLKAEREAPSETPLATQADVIRANAPTEWVEERIVELREARAKGNNAIAETILTLLNSQCVVVSETENGTSWTYDLVEPLNNEEEQKLTSGQTAEPVAEAQAETTTTDVQEETAATTTAVEAESAPASETAQTETVASDTTDSSSSDSDSSASSND